MALPRPRDDPHDAAPGEPHARQAAHCRDCGALAPGAYCPACGQETRLALPGARQFLKEAAGRYFSLDGRMVRTLVALAARPGFLTREYLDGRRKRYVRPARLFLVLSILFFAAVRFTADADQLVISDEPPAVRNGKADSAGLELRIDEDFNVTLQGVQSPLLAPLLRRLDQFNQLGRAEKSRQLFAGAIRYGPYAMVALLPVLALLLKIVYLRRRAHHADRPRRYAEHLVFAAHNHAFLFLAGIVMIATPWAQLHGLLFGWIAWYLIRSMRVVYGGRYAMVTLRALVIGLVYSVMFALAITALFAAAVLLR